MYKFTWFMLLILFVCTLGAFSFDVETPDGNINFNGWVGRMGAEGNWQ